MSTSPLSTDMFSYDKTRNLFSASKMNLGLKEYPDTIYFTSVKTKRVLEFVKNFSSGMENEWWDDELC